MFLQVTQGLITESKCARLNAPPWLINSSASLPVSHLTPFSHPLKHTWSASSWWSNDGVPQLQIQDSSYELFT